MIEAVGPLMTWALDTLTVFERRVYHQSAPREPKSDFPYLVLVFLPSPPPEYHTGSKRKNTGSEESFIVLFNVYGRDSEAVINIGLAMKADIAKMKIVPEGADFIEAALGSQSVIQERDRSRDNVLVWHLTQAVELVIDNRLAG